MKKVFLTLFLVLSILFAASSQSGIGNSNEDTDKTTGYRNNYIELEATIWGFQTISIQYSRTILNFNWFYFGLTTGYGVRESMIRGPGGQMIPGFLYLSFGQNPSWFELSLGAIYYLDSDMYNAIPENQIAPVLKIQYTKANRKIRSPFFTLGFELSRFKMTDGVFDEDIGDNRYRIAPSIVGSFGYLF